MKPVIVVGAGPNGLAAAFYAARAGLKTVVVERRPIVGGGAVTEEILPGYRCPAVGHGIAPVPPPIMRDMQLDRRGVQFVSAEPRLVAISPDSPPLRLFDDIDRTVPAIAELSAEDARAYPGFCSTLARLATFTAPLLDSAPPSLNEPDAGELWHLLKIGRRFRGLPRIDAYRLLRWLPMAAADLVAEWFSSDLLQAAIAARGIAGVGMGPWSAGTGAILLLNAALDPAPAGGSAMIRGGPGALTTAMADACRDAGVDIQAGSAVERIIVRGGEATGVLLDGGREIAARAVLSSADPKRTFLELLDPGDLDPAFRAQALNYRSRGVVAKVNLALSGLPALNGLAPEDLRGRIHVGPGIDYLERAFDASKYGGMSREPYLDITLPSLHDPSLAPRGGHVMSIQVQYVTSGRSTPAEIVLDCLEQYAPGISTLVVHRQVRTPSDIEEIYGMTGGHVLHGEPSLDQLFSMRPFVGWAQYRTPIAGLYLCGAGTHPGPFATGGSGRNAAMGLRRDLKKKSPGVQESSQ